MKRLVLTALVATCAASVFAQGTVIFNNRIAGTVIAEVYQNAAVMEQIRGNGTGDTPAGTVNWTGYTRIGGSGYSAQLLAAPGAGVAETSTNLVAALPIATFRTGSGAGWVAGTTATLNNVAPDAAVASVMMVAWENKGQYNTWAAAQTAWKAGLIAAGTSGTFDVLAIGGTANGAASMNNLRSFNIYMIPEPSTFALAGLGAAAMLIFRRRK